MSKLFDFIHRERLKRRIRRYATFLLRKDLTIYPQVLDPEAERILVLAPHADDETIGAGGTIIRHIEAGGEVIVAIFTDNRDSIPGQSPERAITIREDECREAMSRLGVPHLRFLRVSPDELLKYSGPVRQLCSLVLEYEPHVLYLPTIFDEHQHHRMLNRITGIALKKLSHVPRVIRAYEVWSAIIPNRVVDISPSYNRKIHALRAYSSQLAEIDYIHHIQGLNAYRSMTIPGSRYAEAFMELPGGLFSRFVNTYLT